MDRSTAWPRTLITAVDHGSLVKIVGAVRPADGAVLSLVYKERCVAWETTFDVGGGHLESRTDKTDFRVEDSTGVAAVRVAGASLWLFGGSFRIGQIEPWVAASLFGFERQPRAGPMEFREAVFAEGDIVAVVGRAIWTHPPHHSVYREGRQQLQLASSRDEPLIIVRNPRHHGPRHHRPPNS